MKKKKKSDANNIKEKLLQSNTKGLGPNDYVSTGSTLLNLAISGNPNWGFAKGHYYRFVGDSASGKTWMCLTCFAEACLNPNFKNHRLIYDDVEGGALMDIDRFFGKDVAAKLEAPRYVDGEAVHSATVEDFYFHVDDAIKDGRPFIYVLDSMDGLSTVADEEKFDEIKVATRKGKKTSGSYGTSKARKNSDGLHLAVGRIKNTESIIIIISQTRDNINPMAMGGKTCSGGHALRFYAGLEIWSSVRKPIEKTVRGKKRQLGSLCKVRVKKNRITGRDRSVMLPFYHSYGLDDVGSLCDYLVEEGYFKEGSNGINAKDFEFTGKREALIKYIQTNKLEKDLRSIVADVWKEIEDACVLDRNPRYA